MRKPVLIVMAAGLGSRYGGLKQIAPVDDTGHILIDYSIYDAHQAGFDKVICVITPQLEQDFREIIGDRISAHMDVQYAYQKLDTLPEGFEIPQGRVKPWGTAHAVLSAKNLVDAPFAVINADDYYGSEAFCKIYDFLCGKADDTHHAMVGYRLENTVTEHGYVARGVCREDDNGNLLEIIERTHIEMLPDGIAYTEDGKNYVYLPTGTIVSMNLWGFGLSAMGEIESRFCRFLKDNLQSNPLKCEYFLPFVPNALIEEKKAQIKVLSTSDKWYGVTYADDMPKVRGAIAEMKADIKYPEYLWG